MHAPSQSCKTPDRSKIFDTEPFLPTHLSSVMPMKVGQLAYFNKKYLLEAGTPKLYLKSVSYHVDLGGKHKKNMSERFWI